MLIASKSFRLIHVSVLTVIFTLVRPNRPEVKYARDTIKRADFAYRDKTKQRIITRTRIYLTDLFGYFNALCNFYTIRGTESRPQTFQNFCDETFLSTVAIGYIIKIETALFSSQIVEI